MRLSELLKDKEGSKQIYIPRLPPAKEEKLPVRPPEPVVGPSREELEKEIRTRLGEELEKKLKEKGDEATKLHEQKMKEAEARLEIEFQRRLEAEKMSLSKTKSEDTASLQELLRKYQEKIHDLENRLQAKELEIYRSQVKASTPPEAKPERYSNISHETPPPPTPQESFISRPSTFQGRAPKPNLEDGDYRGDAEKYYQLMLRTAQEIFDQTVAEKPLALEALKKTLGDIAEFLSQSDTDIIRLCLQPYQEGAYFTHHSVNVALLSLILGLDYNLDKEEMRDLGIAALLHDIALARIKESLNYPKQLTPDIEKEVLEHPEKGAEMLRGLVPDSAVLAISQHHESTNGKGYPRGLDGKQTHPYAKIIHVIDAFEALTHERPYRQKPMDVNTAMKEIIEMGRGIYDGIALKALIGRIGLYPVGSMVELSNKQVGRVIRQNRESPLSPIVRIEFDEWGNKMNNLPLLDLSQHHLVHVIGPITDTPAYGKMRIQQSNEPATLHRDHPLAGFIPMILILIVLGLLVYVVLKI